MWFDAASCQIHLAARRAPRAARRNSLVHDRATWDRAFGRQASSRVLYVDGDSVVPEAASEMPTALRVALNVESAETRRSHRRLLLDPRIVESIGEFVRGDVRPVTRMARAG